MCVTTGRAPRFNFMGLALLGSVVCGFCGLKLVDPVLGVSNINSFLNSKNKASLLTCLSLSHQKSLGHSTLAGIAWAHISILATQASQFVNSIVSHAWRGTGTLCQPSWRKPRSNGNPGSKENSLKAQTVCYSSNIDHAPPPELHLLSRPRRLPLGFASSVLVT